MDTMESEDMYSLQTPMLIKQELLSDNEDTASLDYSETSESYHGNVKEEDASAYPGYENPYKCGICDDAFATSAALVDHISAHFGAQKQKERKTRKKRKLESDTDPNTEVKVQCTEASDIKIDPSLTLDQDSNATEPDQEDDDSDSFTCEQLEQADAESYDSEFQCDICQKVLCNKYQLRDHKRIHNNDKCVECNLCHQKFHTNHTLRKHKIRKHSEKGERPYKCDKCQKTFYFSSDLKSHSKVHNASHSCTVCSRVFVHKSTLAMHMRTHNGEKLFECDICDHIFSNSKNLRRHKLRIHKVVPEQKRKDSKTDGQLPVSDSEEEVPANNDVSSQDSDTQLSEVDEQQVSVLDQVNDISGAEIYQCDICQKVLSGKQRLKEHQQTHLEEKAFQCKICDTKFYTNGAFYKHKVLKHPETDASYKCALCDKSFHFSFDLRQHEVIHYGNTCKMCDEEFDDKSSLVMHLDIHTDEHPFICTGDACDQSFISMKSLRNHQMRIHDKYTPYQCFICAVQFPYQSGLKDHLPIHSTENIFDNVQDQPIEETLEQCVSNSDFVRAKEEFLFKQDQLQEYIDALNKREAMPEPVKPVRYECDICNKTVSSSKQLREHKKLHSDEKTYHCEICFMSFFTRTSRYKHKVRRHAYKKTKYKCKDCSKEFDFPYALKAHESIHTGNYHHLCSICGKGLTTPGSLKTHMRSHSGEKPFQCDFCDQRFVSASGLKLHRMNIHTGERPYQCDICAKQFSYPRGLQDHMTVHTGERSYKCPVCDKSYKTASTLRKHKQLHVDENTHECQLCSKTFKTASYLRTHLKSHSGEKPFSCEVCNKRFARAENVRTHMVIHTGEKPYKCDICHQGFTQNSAMKTHRAKHKEWNR